VNSKELPMVSECNFQGKSLFFMQPIKIKIKIVALCKLMNQDDWFFLIVGTFKTRMTNCPNFFFLMCCSI